MPKVKLYSVQEGEQVDYDLEVDRNGELVASHGDEVLKFPAGLTKAEFNKLVDRHNKANEGVVALTEEEIKESEERVEKSRKLIEELEKDS